MAQKRISMKRIREIIRLTETCDLSMRQIAGALNISRPVISQYLTDFKASRLSYEQIETMSDSDLATLFEKKKKGNSRYEDLLGRFDHITKEVKRTGVTLHTLWEEYSKEKPDGYSYSQFCFHYQMWSSTQTVTMHLDLWWPGGHSQRIRKVLLCNFCKFKVFLTIKQVLKTSTVDAKVTE